MIVAVMAKASIAALVLLDILADGIRTSQDSIEQLSQSQAVNEKQGTRSRSGDFSEGYSTGNEHFSGFPLPMSRRWSVPVIPRTSIANLSPVQVPPPFPPSVGADSLEAGISRSIEKEQLSLRRSMKRDINTFIFSQSNDESRAAKTHEMVDKALEDEETKDTSRAKRGKRETNGSDVEYDEQLVSQKKQRMSIGRTSEVDEEEGHEGSMKQQSKKTFDAEHSETVEDISSWSIEENDESAFKADHQVEAAWKRRAREDTKSSQVYEEEARHRKKRQNDNMTLKVEGAEGVFAKKEEHKFKKASEEGVDDKLFALDAERNEVASPVLRRSGASEDLTHAILSSTLSEAKDEQVEEDLRKKASAAHPDQVDISFVGSTRLVQIVKWAARVLNSELRDIIREWVDKGRIAYTEGIIDASDGDYYIDSRPESSEMYAALTSTSESDRGTTHGIYSGDPEPYLKDHCADEKALLRKALNDALEAYESWMQVPDQEFLESLPNFIEDVVNHAESSLSMNLSNAKGQLPHDEALFKEALAEMTRHLQKLQDQYYQDLYSFNFTYTYTYNYTY